MSESRRERNSREGCFVRVCYVLLTLLTSAIFQSLENHLKSGDDFRDMLVGRSMTLFICVLIALATQYVRTAQCELMIQV